MGPARLDRRESATFVLALLATLLFVGAVRALFSSIHYQNLVAFRVTGSVAFAFFLTASFTLFLDRRVSPRGALLLGVGLLAGSRLAMLVTWGTSEYLLFAGLACAGFVILLPAVFAVTRAAVDTRVLTLGLALGWVADLGLTLAGDSRDLTVGADAYGPLLVIVTLLAFAVYSAVRRGTFPARAERPTVFTLEGALVGGLAFGAWVFLLHANFGNVFAASGGELAIGESTVMLLTGFAFGVLLVAADPARVRGTLRLVILNAFLIAATLHEIVPAVPRVGAFLVVAAAALVVDLAVLVERFTRGTLREGAVAVGVAGGVMVALHLAYAITFTVPAPSLTPSFLSLGERVLFPLAGLTLLLSTVALDRAHPAGPRRRLVSRSLVAPALVVGMVAIVAVVSLAGAAPPEARTGDAREAITLVTFNLHHGFNNDGVIDPEGFITILRALDADIVALQETPAPAFTNANLDIPHYVSRRLGHFEAHTGMTLLSRYPILDARHVPLASGGGDQGTLRATLDVHGTRVTVYVVHLGHGDRIPQASRLLAHAEEALAEGPVVLAGDFNSCPTGSCRWQRGFDGIYDAMTRTFDDAWTAAGHAPNDPAGWTISARNPRNRIDYVLVSPGIEVEDARVIRTDATRDASDHLPLLVTMRI